MSNEKGISIIICCYNSSERLSTTLAHIGKQKVADYIPWELIIVNNNSTDNTKEAAENYLKGYKSSLSYQIVDQPIPGLSHARKKGIEVAKFDYLLFCDDDNWLNEHYVQTAFEIMEEQPSVGALGGLGIPICEVAPPSWFNAFPGVYAVGKQYKSSGPVIKSNGILYGAGIVLRKSAVLQIHRSGYQFMLTGRKGKSLSSGEDSEICLALQIVGYQMWYDERLVFHHFIPQDRLSLNYVWKVTVGFGKSYAYLKLLSLKLQGKSLNHTTWICQLASYLQYLLSPKYVYSYIRHRKSRNSWFLVSYPAHWYALIDLIYMGFKIGKINQSIDKMCNSNKKPDDKHVLSQ